MPQDALEQQYIDLLEELVTDLQKAGYDAHKIDRLNRLIGYLTQTGATECK